MMGRILCASFVTLDGEPYTFRYDEKPWIGKNKIDDAKLCVAIRDELEKFNLIVGWNSKLHDIPLLNARLAKAGQRPYHCQNFHLDAMWYAGGSSMKIGSRKLDNVAKFFSLNEQKTEISWDDWQLAGSGDKKAMATVVHHCEQDVKVLRDTYHHILLRFYGIKACACDECSTRDILSPPRQAVLGSPRLTRTPQPSCSDCSSECQCSCACGRDSKSSSDG